MVSDHPPVEHQLHHLYHEEGVAFGLVADQALERRKFDAATQDRIQHLSRVLTAQRVEPQMRVELLLPHS